MGICCGSAAQELAEAAPHVGGEDYSRQGLLAKGTMSPLTLIEKTQLPFCLLLCSAFERELNAQKQTQDDYDEPFVEIGNLKSSLSKKPAWAETFNQPESSAFWLFIKHDFLKARRVDGLLVPCDTTDNIKLSYFKMMCVGILLGAGKRIDKAHMFERLVN